MYLYKVLTISNFPRLPFCINQREQINLQVQEEVFKQSRSRSKGIYLLQNVHVIERFDVRKMYMLLNESTYARNIKIHAVSTTLGSSRRCARRKAPLFASKAQTVANLHSKCDAFTNPYS